VAHADVVLGDVGRRARSRFTAMFFTSAPVLTRPCARALTTAWRFTTCAAALQAPRAAERTDACTASRFSRSSARPRISATIHTRLASQDQPAIAHVDVLHVLDVEREVLRVIGEREAHLLGHAALVAISTSNRVIAWIC
jgi:hypothetical protein